MSIAYVVERHGVIDDGPPCEGAHRLSCMRRDGRTTDDPAKVPAYNGGTAWWYDEGTNHRVVNGRIERDIPDETWIVVFHRFSEFQAFVEKHSPCVVGHTSDMLDSDGKTLLPLLELNRSV